MTKKRIQHTDAQWKGTWQDYNYIMDILDRQAPKWFEGKRFKIDPEIRGRMQEEAARRDQQGD